MNKLLNTTLWVTLGVTLSGFLLVAPPALAQDDCSSCQSGCSDCDSAPAGKSSCDELTKARKELSTWKTDLRGLSRVERNALKGAHKTLMTKDAAAQALAPTFGAAADLLAILAALDMAVAKDESECSKVANEMSATYRAMAQALAGKNSYPAPSLKTTDELKVALKKCDADAKKAQALWVQVKKTELSTEDAAAIADAKKLLQQASPRMRALAINSTAAGSVIKAFKCTEAKAEGDMRPALMKTAKSLHASAAPYFKNVVLEKPQPMAPAPST